MCGIARGLCRSLHLNTANVCHHLPDFFVAHAHADAAIGRRGHGRACNAVVNVVENLRVRAAVPLLRTRKIWPASSPARAQPVTESAVQPKLVFAQLGDLRVPGVGILLLRKSRRSKNGKSK